MDPRVKPAGDAYAGNSPGPDRRAYALPSRRMSLSTALSVAFSEAVGSSGDTCFNF